MLNEVTGKYFSIVANNNIVNCTTIVDFLWQNNEQHQYEFSLRVNEKLEDLRYTQISDYILNQVAFKLDDIADDFIAKGLVIVNESPVSVKKTIKPEIKKEKIKDFNLKIYKDILDDFNIQNEHDRKYIANRLAKFYKKHKQLSNIRICRSNRNKLETELYTYLKRKSEAYHGNYEELMYNVVTDNYFLVGFIGDCNDE